MSDFVQAIKGSYSLHEGYGVVYQSKADASNYKSISPTVNKGKTIVEFNALYGARFDRPRYYTSTPSGLPY